MGELSPWVADTRRGAPMFRQHPPRANSTDRKLDRKVSGRPGIPGIIFAGCEYKLSSIVRSDRDRYQQARRGADERRQGRKKPHPPTQRLLHEGRTKAGEQPAPRVAVAPCSRIGDCAVAVAPPDEDRAIDPKGLVTHASLACSNTLLVLLHTSLQMPRSTPPYKRPHFGILTKFLHT